MKSFSCCNCLVQICKGSLNNFKVLASRNLVQNKTGFEQLHLLGIDKNSSIPHFLVHYVLWDINHAWKFFALEVITWSHVWVTEVESPILVKCYWCCWWWTLLISSYDLWQMFRFLETCQSLPYQWNCSNLSEDIDDFYSWKMSLKLVLAFVEGLEFLVGWGWKTRIGIRPIRKLFPIQTTLSLVRLARKGGISPFMFMLYTCPSLRVVSFAKPSCKPNET